MSFLKLINIHKSFNNDKGEIKVLEGISLDIGFGEFLVIVGPSGCGKSTLLKLMAGLERPDKGTVFFENGAQESGDKVLVFQNPLLFPWATVEQNVEFGLKLKGVPKSERKKRTTELLKKLGLQGFERFYPHQISGGMQHRVALARALAVNPTLILMDEPFTSVDPLTRESLQEELLRMWETTGSTVVFVTHSLREALLLGDRICVLTQRPASVKGEYKIDIPRPRYRHLSILAEMELNLKEFLTGIKPPAV